MCLEGREGREGEGARKAIQKKESLIGFDNVASFVTFPFLLLVLCGMHTSSLPPSLPSPPAPLSLLPPPFPQSFQLLLGQPGREVRKFLGDGVDDMVLDL